ncbi:MAG: O-antigen ligase family protein [Planctomycetota bacterium]|nr:O-antigen ligase family protein [Planctomycetota bacterium]MDA1177818.1 O-antigen ligase family protein [Planctomycetota bacterium]
MNRAPRSQGGRRHVRSTPADNGTSSVPLMAKLIPAGLFALCVATPLIPSESDGYVGTSVVLAVAWVLWLVTWALACATNSRSGVLARVGRIDIVWLILLVLLSISTWWAMRTGNQRLAANDWARWVLVFTMPFLCRQILVEPVHQRCLVLVMVSMAVIFAAHGFHQVLYTQPRMRLAYEQDPDTTLRDLRIDAPAGSALRTQFENRLRSPEPLATFALTNSLAGFLLPWLGIVVALAVRGTRERGNRQFTVSLWVIMALLVGCFWLTNSRSAHAAFLIGSSLAVLGSCPSRQQRRLVVALLIAAGTIVILAALGHLPEGPIRSAWQSLSYRLEYWQATWAMIWDYPLFGCGPGQFQDTYTAYKLPQSSETIADPHNMFFELAAVLGLPALLSFLLLGTMVRTQSAPEPFLPTATQLVSSAASRESVVWAVGGAAAGYFFAFLLGAIVGFPPDGVLIWLGLPIAIGCLAQGWDWVHDGELPTSWIWLALLMLMVHLMGAGGVSFAGVAVGLAVLWGILAARSSGATPRPLPWWGPGICAVLMIVVVQWAYWPMVQMQASLAEGDLLVQQAGQGRDAADVRWKQALDAYQRGAMADPLSPQPWMRLAAMSHAVWLQSHLNRNANETVRWQEQFMEASRRVIELQPRSSGALRQIGIWHLAAYRTTNEKELLAQALSLFEQARRRYPSFAPLQAEYAWLAHLAGHGPAAHSAAVHAMELDRLNPHEEHALSRQILPDPGPSPNWSAEQPPGPDSRATDDWMQSLAQSMTTPP